jgi:hypothetical protein
MEINEEDYLAHYGILRKSGRYPWGSGETQEERNRTFLGMVDDCKKKGLSEKTIAQGFGITTTELREAKAIAKNAQKQADINMAQRLKDKGYSNIAIGERMGKPESTIRALLKPGEEAKAQVLKSTADILRDSVEKHNYIDIGSGVEQHMGITSTKLKNAVAILKEEGYTVHRVQVEQLGTGNMTTVKVLAPPGTTRGEVYKNRDNIRLAMGYSEDGGHTYDRILPPLHIDSKRVAVRYGDEGGSSADGVIYVRPGVKDVSLGASRYAQVRIAVDGTHYLKGMAMYKDDLPEGADLMFNTNKKSTGNKLDAMKPLSSDPDNPFGALIKRQIQEGEPGKKHVASAMNIVNEEGDWEEWSKSLSSQMLSKQSPKLAKTQLELVSKNKRDELADIMALTNPAAKRKLLLAFADGADASSIHLKAAAFPNQSSHVILPINSMKPTEVYAPKFRDGSRVVLIRFPHGGTFEIPELVVNNRHPEAKKLLGPSPKDAIGIHSSVAERLSGADFDGDTVLVIPNNDRKIKTAPALEGLKGFDPQKYKLPEDSPIRRMSPRTKQVEMGKISNLIADMTVKGASHVELARAVRHSMVVIDAEKHHLDYRQSAIDNNIAQLRKKYQKTAQGGASTLISVSGINSTVHIPEIKKRPAEQGGFIDRATGKKMYVPTGATYVDKNGKTQPKTTEVSRLAIVDDAHVHSSGTPIEQIYADHSNVLKALANEARKEMISTKNIPYSPAAKVKYAEQVRALEAKLNLALRNSPLERQAQILANAIVRQKQESNPDMEPATLRRLKTSELTKARLRAKAKKQLVEITPEEWTAIQAGAITNHRLTQIMDNADLDVVRQLATPKNRPQLDEPRKNRAVAMLRNGYTQAEVADMMGVSVSTLKRSLSEGDA